MNHDVKALPECFDFAMDFLGDPEATEIRAYIEQQNAAIAELRAEVERLQGEADTWRDNAEEWCLKYERDRKRADTAEARLEEIDRLLRASVPEQWKTCTSAVGAAQSHIADLEGRAEEATELLKVMWEQGECYSSAVEWPRLLDAEGFYARVAAFLGDGNG